MAITEGSPQETDWSTGYLTAKEAQVRPAEVVNLGIAGSTQKQSSAIARLKELGGELRRVIRAGRRSNGGGHSVGL